MSAQYLIRPKADRDLEDQAFYLATRGSPELGHRFLIAAHEAFVLLAKQPNIGWQARLKDPELVSLRIFSISGFEKMLALSPTSPGSGDTSSRTWCAKLVRSVRTGGD